MARNDLLLFVLLVSTPETTLLPFQGQPHILQVEDERTTFQRLQSKKTACDGSNNQYAK
jgi:hypothetical protein